jgi:hypothetical protein
MTFIKLLLLTILSATINDTDTYFYSNEIDGLINETDTSLYFNEVNGLLVAEFESIDPAPGWTEKTDRAGFSGTSFFEWTSNNLFNSPGMGLNEYLIKINNPGTYRFQWRCKVGHGSDATEANDSWLRIRDARKFYAVKAANNDTVRPKGICIIDCPEGSGSSGFFKLYSSGTTNWTWTSRTSDSDPHIIYVDFDSPGFYRVQISGRSKHHLLDRFILHKPSVNTPTNLNIAETKVNNRIRNHGKLILKIKNELSNENIPNASVFLNSKLKICDNSGSVFYYKFDRDTTHPIIIKKDGYQEFTEEIKINGDTIITVQLKSIPTKVNHLFSKQPELKVTPNPCKDYCRIRAKSAYQGVIKNIIFDINGNKVREVIWNKNSEDSSFKLNLDGLKTGSYLLLTDSDQKSHCQKLFVIQ